MFYLRRNRPFSVSLEWLLSVDTRAPVLMGFARRLLGPCRAPIRPFQETRRNPMITKLLSRVAASLAVVALASGAAVAKVTIAIGGGRCPCFPPTPLAGQHPGYNKNRPPDALPHF